MLKITDPALEHLVTMRSRPDEAFRLVIAQDGTCTLQTTEPRTNDVVAIEHDGKPLLVLDPSVDDAVAGRTLGIHQSKFRLMLAMS